MSSADYFLPSMLRLNSSLSHKDILTYTIHTVKSSSCNSLLSLPLIAVAKIIAPAVVNMLFPI